MKIPGAKRWMQFVLCYWGLMIVVMYLEIKYMTSNWAGLPGFLLSLPLSVLVVTVYLVASYLNEVYGYGIHVTEYQIEYGFLICAFVNGFLFYPFYWWQLTRRSPSFESRPPPPSTFQW